MMTMTMLLLMMEEDISIVKKRGEKGKRKRQADDVFFIFWGEGHGIRRTVEFVRIVEDAGADYVTVHGRRRSQKSTEPVDLDAIKLVKDHATVPVVANGDAFSLDDVRRIADFTGADGKTPPPLWSRDGRLFGFIGDGRRDVGSGPDGESHPLHRFGEDAVEGGARVRGPRRAQPAAVRPRLAPRERDDPGYHDSTPPILAAERRQHARSDRLGWRQHRFGNTIMDFG